MIIDNDFEYYFHWESSQPGESNPITPAVRIYFKFRLPRHVAGQYGQNDSLDNKKITLVI